MTFLGIELDTIAMEAILPLDNVLKIKNSLSEMRVRRNVTLRELQSLIGLLSFVCCVVQPGRTFLRRLIDHTKGIQQPHFHIRLNKESRLDIAAWLLVIDHFNGKPMLLKQIGFRLTICIYTRMQLGLWVSGRFLKASGFMVHGMSW